MKINKLIISCAILFFSTSFLSAQTKIGYINSLELLSFMPEIKKSDSVLQLLASELEKQYTIYISDYQQKLNDFNQNAATWSDVKKESVEQDLLTLQKRIADFEHTSQQKIDTRKQDLYDPILKKANEIVQQIGKEKNLTCILDTAAGTVIYIGEDMVDLMPDVKQKLNL